MHLDKKKKKENTFSQTNINNSIIKSKFNITTLIYIYTYIYIYSTHRSFIRKIPRNESKIIPERIDNKSRTLHARSVKISFKGKKKNKKKLDATTNPKWYTMEWLTRSNDYDRSKNGSHVNFPGVGQSTFVIRALNQTRKQVQTSSRGWAPETSCLARYVSVYQYVQGITPINRAPIIFQFRITTNPHALPHQRVSTTEREEMG